MTLPGAIRLDLTIGKRKLGLVRPGNKDANESREGRWWKSEFLSTGDWTCRAWGRVRFVRWAREARHVQFEAPVWYRQENQVVEIVFHVFDNVWISLHLRETEYISLKQDSNKIQIFFISSSFLSLEERSRRNLSPSKKWLRES